MTVEVLGAAQADAEEAQSFYESARQGLGDAFVTELEFAISRIADQPFVWPPLDDIYRRYLLKRFPYGIIYRVNEAEATATIVAIEHLHRRPDRWRRRER